MMLLQNLIHISHGKKIEPSLSFDLPTHKYTIPVLGKGLKEIGYITEKAHKDIYTLLSDDETIVMSSQGEAKVQYVEKLSMVAPNESTYILQNLAPELINFKYLYYRFEAMEKKLNNIMNTSPSKKLPIDELKNILIGWYL